MLSFKESLEVVGKALCFLALCVISGLVSRITCGSHGNPQRKTLNSSLTPASYGQWNCFPLWYNYFLMPGTPKWNFKPINHGEKNSRVNYIDVFTRLWDDTTPMYLLSLPWSDVTVDVEGDLIPHLMTDVWSVPTSRCASWRQGSVSSRRVMAKVTILSCSWWAATLTVALIWQFLSSWGHSEG